MERGARRPGSGRAALLAAAVALALLAGRGLAYGFPVPAVHDEHAYLLAADTFRSGRVTNPTHPFWEHLQSFHVLQRPTTQAKYPPGQGATLALGMLLGHAAWGVWLTMAAAVGATVWLLAAELPLLLAALVPLAFVLHQPVLEQWGQSYWGGGLALLGGSLFFGALLRLRRAFDARLAWTAVAGLWVLGNTRPAEGALAVALGLALGAAQGAGPRRSLRRSLPILGAGLAALAAWWLWYDWRVTGHPLRLPYLQWRAEDATLPWMRAYRGSAPLGVPGKLRRLAHFHLGGVLLPALPFLWLARRRPAARLAAVVVGASVLASVAWTRAWPHYLAPASGLVLLLGGEALWSLWRLRLARLAPGPAVVVALLTTHVALGAGRQVARLRAGPGDSWHLRRQAIEDELVAAGGRHLVLVPWDPRRSLHEPWVANAAGVDAAPVVWAHDLGPERNRPFLEHMRGRRVWSVRPWETPVVPRPLEGASGLEPGVLPRATGPSAPGR